MQKLGWHDYDVLLVTGDAFIDHPSFGVAIIGRLLERMGLKVCILSQPNFKNTSEFLHIGKPNLFIGITSGTVDSMINNYTANKRKRSDDMYTEGGESGKRPDYATYAYTKLAKEAFPDTPIILGGIEASLRRLAHFDYWKNIIRPSILVETEADYLIYGMAENSIIEVTRHIQNGNLDEIKNVRGVCYTASKSTARNIEPRITLPSFEEVKTSKKKYLKTAIFVEKEINPFNAKTLIQDHARTTLVVNPPSLPLSTEEFDNIYELTFTRLPHPKYNKQIPAYEMIKHSVTSTRGCFGGCTFCALSLHQGKIIQSRSPSSIKNEIIKLTKLKDFTGIVSDIGGPTANSYMLGCNLDDTLKKCKKPSCVSPSICNNLNLDHTKQIELLEELRNIEGVKKIHITSGIRYDYALADQTSGNKYLNEIIAYHISGQLKVAPEHLDPPVLSLMRKPNMKDFDDFVNYFSLVTKAANKEQYLVPYFISGFPGCSAKNMEVIYNYLKGKGWKIRQVQSFIPSPMTLASAMYWSEMDYDFNKIYVAKDIFDKKLQQALLQPFKRENLGLIRKHFGKP